MPDNGQNKTFKKFLLFVAGFFILILGVALILAWWPAVTALFQGSIGVILALGGLLMLYGLNKMG